MIISRQDWKIIDSPNLVRYFDIHVCLTNKFGKRINVACMTYAAHKENNP